MWGLGGRGGERGDFKMFFFFSYDRPIKVAQCNNKEILKTFALWDAS
jgi:hypothetical protein